MNTSTNKEEIQGEKRKGLYDGAKAVLRGKCIGLHKNEEKSQCNFTP